MESLHQITAIGLMSGTSISGVDAAILKTDGVDIYSDVISITRHYDNFLKDAIRSLLGKSREDNPEHYRKVEVLLTMFHKDTVNDLLAKAGIELSSVDVIGFHGHTILHKSSEGITRQLGDAELLANELNTKVVSRFRNVDVKSGGQGAPLESAYLVSLSEKKEKPLGFINIGGVANITVIGANGDFTSFHTGPGNALIDDWVKKRYDIEMDFDGLIAAKGTPDDKIINNLLKDEFFAKRPPKSIDRNDFLSALKSIDGLSVADGAATLTAFTAASIVEAIEKYISKQPSKWIVFGGGANNPTLLRFIRERLNAKVVKAEEEGLNSNTLEAESFAYLAARSLFRLPLTFPSTTGVAEPLTGGKLYIPSRG